MLYPGRCSAWQTVTAATMPSMIEVPKESIIANTDFTTTSLIAKRYYQHCHYMMPTTKIDFFKRCLCVCMRACVYVHVGGSFYSTEGSIFSVLYICTYHLIQVKVYCV